MAAKNKQQFVMNADMGQLIQLFRDPRFASEQSLIFRSENPANGGVWYRFHHGTSFSSWGEKITITLLTVGPNQVSVEILSECGMPTQVIDWGKNKSNVEGIIRYINSNLHFYAQASAQNYVPASQQPPVQPPVQPSVAQDFKFCGRCGYRLPVDAGFCGKCGTRQ